MKTFAIRVHDGDLTIVVTRISAQEMLVVYKDSTACRSTIISRREALLL